MGRLWQVVGSATTQFLYDGDELVGEYDGAGNLVRRYAHGANIDDPVVWYEGATVGVYQRRYLLADHQGSITSIGDANGNLSAINAYDAWGIPNTGNTGRFQYTGQAWLAELGMYHYKARLYSPTLGRFMQTDPVGYDDQINLYAYVGNDPLNRTDPTGRQTVQDMQLQMHIADMRMQGMTEREILAQIGTQAAIEAEALFTFATFAEGGIAVIAARQAYRAAGWAGVRHMLGMSLGFSMSNAQLGAKFASHHREWGLSGGREGVERFRSIVTNIATQPERVVNGTFSGGEAGRRAAQFRIRGDDVVVTTRRGEFITILKDGLSNGWVQQALRTVCTGTRIASMGC